MATKKSTQETNRTATPVTLGNPNELGKVVRYWFDYTCATFNNADTLQLRTIPVGIGGARLFGGMILTDGLGASTTLTIGDGTTATKYLGSTAIGASATQTAFGNTIALAFGQVLTADLTLTVTLGGANATDAKLVYGYIDVLVAI